MGRGGGWPTRPFPSLPGGRGKKNYASRQASTQTGESRTMPFAAPSLPALPLPYVSLSLSLSLSLCPPSLQGSRREVQGKRKGQGKGGRLVDSFFPLPPLPSLLALFGWTARREGQAGRQASKQADKRKQGNATRCLPPLPFPCSPFLSLSLSLWKEGEREREREGEKRAAW